MSAETACLRCGEGFEPRNDPGTPAQKYCPEACRKAWRERMRRKRRQAGRRDGE